MLPIIMYIYYYVWICCSEWLTELTLNTIASANQTNTCNQVNEVT